MKRVSISCIVEGQADSITVPILIRRIVAMLDMEVRLHIPQPPVRVSRNKIVKGQELETAVEAAALKNNGHGAILIVMDADDDCPATLAPQLLRRAQAARSDMPIAVVLAQKEYEAWFLAAAHSLRGQQGLAATLEPPADPQAISGAKEWLRKNMEGSRTYKETVDQLALTRVFDLAAARRAASFDKLFRDLTRLLAEL